MPNLGQGAERVYAVPAHVGPGGYAVFLAYTEDCNGASFCRFGSLQGRAVPGGKPGLHGNTVRLARGINGFFTPGACGAGCSDSIVEWQQQGAIYAAGVKAGKLEDVVQLANAVVNAKN